MFSTYVSAPCERPGTHDDVTQDVAQRDQTQKPALALLGVLLRFTLLRSTVIDDDESVYPPHPNESEHGGQRALRSTGEDTFKVYWSSSQSLSYCQVQRLVGSQFEQGLNKITEGQPGVPI
jgi:hypothetical protein